ncbi:MAG: hypothetical protein P8184_03175 [Calditrichia bacterium]
MKFWSITLLSLFLPIIAFSQNHLLISEIQTQPANNAFIEIFNPLPNSFPLDSIYLTDYNTYYEMVQGTYSSASSDFLVKFPDGATIASGAVIVVAFDGSGVENADYEIKGTSAPVPDMTPLYVGSNASLSNYEMVMMFSWNGHSDLVKDVDYVMWNTTTATFVNKTGISIDGPDPDSTPSTYLPDTPVDQQKPFLPYPFLGNSIARISVTEDGETYSGGNGITGHDETSEPIDQNFAEQQQPTPGSTDLQVPNGNGSGTASVSPDSIRTDSTLTIKFTLNGNNDNPVTDISLQIPSSWTWTNNSSDVVLGGAAFTGASVSASNGTISITNTDLTFQNSGTIAISALTSPSNPEQSSFQINTAIQNGTLTPISNSPVITVYAPSVIASIAEIQANPSNYTNVTIEGVITIGEGITTDQRLSAYIQDNSGRGINLFSNDMPTNFPDIIRGNKLRVSGEVIEYVNSTSLDHTTEISNFTYQLISTDQALPQPLILSTQSATDTSLEGTYVETSGTINDMYVAGGGTSLVINDGSGDVTVRIWDTSQLNTSGFQIGDLIDVKGIVSSYRLAGQIVVGYQNDIQEITANPGDGSGTASVSPDAVNKGESGVMLDFTLNGENSYTVKDVSLSIPASWQWSGLESDVQISGPGFTGAQLAVQGKTIQVTQAALSSAMSGHIMIQNLTAPDNNEFSTFTVKTATEGGILTTIKSSPRVTVGEGVNATPISLIQLNTAQYKGQTVTIMGVVTFGAGLTTSSFTSAYVQDNSGYGINVYQPGTVDSRLTRGNQVVITGTVDEYNGVTEITGYTLDVLGEGSELPTALILQTGEANDARWEGTYVQVEGEITDLYAAGGGSNVTVDDGTGPYLLRIWDATGVNLSAFAVGDTIVARGVASVYTSSSTGAVTQQMLVGYQDDIFKPGKTVSGDGNGFAEITPANVAPGTGNISATIKMWSSVGDSLRTIEFLVPANWQWSGLADDVSAGGSGLTGAKLKITSEYGHFRLVFSNALVTDNDSAIVTLKGLTAPNDSIYAYFWVKTAVAGGTPTFILESPRIQVGNNPIYQIEDLQTNSGQFKDQVTIRGIVTVGAAVIRTDRTSAFMQDASGFGININKSGAPDTTDFKRGYLIEFNGTVSEYRDVTQITPSGAVQILEEGVPVPKPVEVTTGEANSPIWDGTYVRVKGVVTDKYTTSSAAPYDWNIVVNDGSGPLTLRVWGTTGVNVDSIDVNSAVIASGVGSVFITSDGTPSYQILPAYQEDLVLNPSYQPSLAGVSLDIPPHPFVPDVGEKIAIKYNAGAVNNQVTLRIFDTAGRLITTLLDEQSTLLVNTLHWDGRDRYLNFVPLGTYICHLEVVEPVSGKKRTKLAPIVIGTRLEK